VSQTAPSCPFCDSDQTEQISAWGGQIITSQARCRNCNTYFEVVREDFDTPWTTSYEDDRSEL
jgi:hypothetical protein